MLLSEYSNKLLLIQLREWKELDPDISFDEFRKYHYIYTPISIDINNQDYLITKLEAIGISCSDRCYAVFRR